MSNILTPILLKVGDNGGIEQTMAQYKWFSNGIYAYKGATTNLEIAKKYNLPFKDLSLFLAARL